jgi:hypothetical protein
VRACSEKVAAKEMRHTARVCLIGELPVCRNMVGAIAAAYCREVAEKIDRKSRARIL